MITLDTTGDYLLLILIAAISGLLGGLAAELLLNRDGDTGGFELPRRTRGLLDFGGFASLLVGAVAGVAILLVLPATATIVTPAEDGTTLSTASFDVLRLVATSLVAGSAGGSVLTALQARVTSAVNAARVEFVRATGEEEVDRVRDAALRQIDEMARTLAPAAGPAGTGGGARPRGIGAPPPANAAAAEDAIASAAREIDAVATSGRRAVATAAKANPRMEDQR